MSEDKLLKTDDEKTKAIVKNKGKNTNTNYMKLIYKSLSASDYKPQDTVEIIEEYLGFGKNNVRLMYSELSNHLFSIFEDEKAESDYNLNISKLYEYVNEKNVTPDCLKIVIKIMDHSLLVSYQISGIKYRAEQITKKALEKNEEEFQSNMKDSEKQYITILGIFASIVLSFTAGIAYSTSVFSNIDKASIYRLLVITSLVGLIIFNMIYVMFEFVRDINGKINPSGFFDKLKNPLWLIPNIVLIIVIVFSIYAFRVDFFKKENLDKQKPVRTEGVLILESCELG